LAAALLDRHRVGEVVEELSAEARAALEDLNRNDGSMPWPQFARRYGLVREMGPARRDREEPHRHPVSPAEVLWYRALVATSEHPGSPQSRLLGPAALLPSPEKLKLRC
jgi:hypothetical protein